MIKLFLWIVAISIALRMLSNFLRSIFPSSATTERLRQMQEQMKEMDRKMSRNAATPAPGKSRWRKKDEDYIDYEEVR